MHELITDQPETGQHHCQAALGRIASLIRTAVFKLKGLATGRPSANLFEGIADILIGIASESASLRPADKMSHSGVLFRKISGKLRHFHVTCIAEDESSATVKHAQTGVMLSSATLAAWFCRRSSDGSKESPDRNSAKRENH